MNSRKNLIHMIQIRIEERVKKSKEEKIRKKTEQKIIIHQETIGETGNLPSLQSIPREEITERIIGGNGYLDNRTMAKSIT